MQETKAHTETVAEGIVRVRIPVPFGRLGDVNCYVLKDDAGWTVLDTGLNTPAAQAAWTEALDAMTLAWNDLTRIILTHSHPDHIGLAGWMQEQIREASGCTVPVHLSKRERELARYWSAAGTSDAPLLTLFRRCGAPDELLATVASDMQAIRQATHPHPINMQPLKPGAELTVGPRRLAPLVTPGHSDGHIALHDATDRLILSGDQVLLHITPTISRWPSTTPNPLGRYLESLQTLGALDIRLALPGHGPTVIDWAARIQAIQQHHQDRLNAMLGAVGEGATVLDVARDHFSMGRLAHSEARFAIAETLAHLEYLEANGHIERSDTDVWRFRRL